MSSKIYYVKAYEYGRRNKHNYIVGIYDNFKDAYDAALREEEIRAGKYSCVIHETKMGGQTEDDRIHRTSLDKKLVNEWVLKKKEIYSKLEEYDARLKYLSDILDILGGIEIIRDLEDTPKDILKRDHEFRSKIIEAIKSRVSLERQNLLSKKNLIGARFENLA